MDKDLPSDLDAFAMAVIDLDNRLFRLRQERRLSQQRPFGSSTQKFYPYGTQNPQKEPSAMEMGMIDSGVTEVVINGVTLSNSNERLEEIRNMSPEKRRQTCADEHRCFYCKRVVGSPPSHTAQTCPLNKNKRESNAYFMGSTNEVPPQLGILNQQPRDRIPQRQVFNTKEMKHSDLKNFSSGADFGMYSVNSSAGGVLRLKTGLNLGQKIINVEALVDSGAMGLAYIDKKFVLDNDINRIALEIPVTVHVVDGAPCGNGKIDQKVCLVVDYGTFQEELDLLVIESPRNTVILGFEWLKRHNPAINWAKGTIEINRNVAGRNSRLPRRSSWKASF